MILFPERVELMNARTSRLSAVLLALFFLVTNIHISSRRLFWFDELCTLKIIQLPDLATLWQVQNSFRADSAPTAYLLLVRLFYQLTGQDEFAVRLLSALAVTVALLVIFDCARRLLDGLHGLLAMCVLCLSFALPFGYEGRAYALVVLFTSLALWLWLHTAADSKRAAGAFGALIFLDVSMHFYAVLALVPFALWTVSRWRTGQRPPLKLAAGIAGMLCALVLCIQQMIGMRQFGAPAVAPPTLAALTDVYAKLYPAGPFVLAVFAILACLFRTAAKPVEEGERLCWMFLAIPLAGFAVAEAVTHSFYPRYLITAIPGISVAFVCLASRYLPQKASAALLVCVAGLAIGKQVSNARNPETLEPSSGGSQQLATRQGLWAEETLAREGKTAIVANFAHATALAYYSKRPALYITYAGDSGTYFCRFMGDVCWNLEGMKRHGNELAALYPTDRFLKDMIEAGWQPAVRMTEPLVVYFSPRAYSTSSR